MNPFHPGLVPGGDVRPSRFVKISAAADDTLLEADANEAVIGISSEATAEAPQSGSSGLAGSTTYKGMRFHGIGETCVLELGTGGATSGDELKSDADGKGVRRATTGTTVQNVGALCLQSGSEGDKVRVMVYRTSMRPALT